MLLSEILGSEEYRVISGSVSCNITSVEYDSRKIQSGSLFVAIIGFTSDGHGFPLSAEIIRDSAAVL